jgi:predicted nucleic acid-binding protein
MILIDTSVWVSHLRTGNDYLKQLLTDEKVTTHPFIIGELACGNLNNRNEILTLLQFLPKSNVASNEEVMLFIEANSLMGIGIGFIDAHLLASTLLSGFQIWTLDKKLEKAALQLNINHNPA